jgi:hypothetical protein
MAWQGNGMGTAWARHGMAGELLGHGMCAAWHCELALILHILPVSVHRTIVKALKCSVNLNRSFIGSRWNLNTSVTKGLDNKIIYSFRKAYSLNPKQKCLLFCDREH